MGAGIQHAGIALLIGLLAGLGIPTALWAQAGFYATPSFSFAEVYDDNLFSTSNGRESDIYSRFSPGLQAEYRSAPLTLSGSYAFDAEVYPGYPELTSALAGQRASIEAQYLPTRLLTLSFTGQYAESQTTRDINALAESQTTRDITAPPDREVTVPIGVDQGRRRSQLYSFSPSVSNRFSRLTSGTAGYEFAQVVSEDTTSSHTLNLQLSRQITPGDSATLGFTPRFFTSSEDRTLSYAFTAGWTRQHTRLTSTVLRAGPRVTDGSVGAEVLASISRQIKNGAVSLTYLQSQSLVADVSDAVNVQVLTGSITYTPLRFLQVTATPFFSRNTPVGSEQGDSEARVYGLGLNANYQLNKWLSLVGSYLFSYQQGGLDSSFQAATGDDGDIYHNIVTLGLAITYPYRVY